MNDKPTKEDSAVFMEWINGQIDENFDELL